MLKAKCYGCGVAVVVTPWKIIIGIINHNRFLLFLFLCAFGKHEHKLGQRKCTIIFRCKECEKPRQGGICLNYQNTQRKP